MTEPKPGRAARDELRAAFMAGVSAEKRRITELAVESRATCIAQGGVEIPFADLIGEHARTRPDKPAEQEYNQARRLAAERRA